MRKLQAAGAILLGKLNTWEYGIVRQFGDGAPAPDPANSAAMEAAAALLADQGATVTEMRLPAPLPQYEAVTSVIDWSESYSIHERDFMDRGAEMGQALRDKMMSGVTVRAADYLAASASAAIWPWALTP